jgi:NAD(P)-dependent dehydrogenase (short-subunit alcohol dehydrogenase family)
MTKDTGTILLIGASRGLGFGLVHEYLSRGWSVIATARNPDKAKELKALAAAHGERLRIEALDVTHPAQAGVLAQALGRTKVDVIFVVAGQSSQGPAPIHAATTEQAASEFITNSYAPPVVAEHLLPVLTRNGVVVFMTSILGSLARTQGGMELYNASKAALNMLGINFAQRHPEIRVLLMHPGWVRTDMGGSQAPLDVETSTRNMATAIEQHGKGTGVAYIDHEGHSLPW